MCKRTPLVDCESCGWAGQGEVTATEKDRERHLSINEETIRTGKGLREHFATYLKSKLTSFKYISSNTCTLFVICVSET